MNTVNAVLFVHKLFALQFWLLESVSLTLKFLMQREMHVRLWCGLERLWLNTNNSWNSHKLGLILCLRISCVPCLWCRSSHLDLCYLWSGLLNNQLHPWFLYIFLLWSWILKNYLSFRFWSMYQTRKLLKKWWKSTLFCPWSLTTVTWIWDTSNSLSAFPPRYDPFYFPVCFCGSSIWIIYLKQ